MLAGRSRMLVAGVAGAFLVALTGLTAACGTGTAGTDPPAAGAAGVPGAPGAPAGSSPASISETGSTLLYPLMRAWAAAYHQQVPAVTVSTAATGSGAGIAAASKGTADIGTSDAYLSSGDLVENPALLNIPLAISAQQVDYNLPGVGAGTHVRLDGQVLALMYQGTITSWNDPAIAALNAGVRLPAVRVVPVHRSDSSGDTF